MNEVTGNFAPSSLEQTSSLSDFWGTGGRCRPEPRFPAESALSSQKATSDAPAPAAVPGNRAQQPRGVPESPRRALTCQRPLAAPLPPAAPRCRRPARGPPASVIGASARQPGLCPWRPPGTAAAQESTHSNRVSLTPAAEASPRCAGRLPCGTPTSRRSLGAGSTRAVGPRRRGSQPSALGLGKKLST